MNLTITESSQRLSTVASVKASQAVICLFSPRMWLSVVKALDLPFVESYIHSLGSLLIAGLKHLVIGYSSAKAIPHMQVRVNYKLIVAGADMENGIGQCRQVRIQFPL